MFNPYICYAIAFAVALILYPLGWSDLYPPLSTPVVLFLGGTVIIHLIAGVYLAKTKLVTFTRLPAPASRQSLLHVTLFIYVLWTAEFLYARNIPLLSILTHQPYDYRTFGIPSLHVFVVTFSSFYTIFLFHHYLSRRSRRTLAFFLINLGAALLIYNRGMFLFNLSACLLLFLIYKGRLSFRQLALISVFVLIVSYLFGVMGSLRVSNEARTPYSNRHFLATGEASQSFRNSVVPPEFFWAYVYATSPLANLEQNVRSGHVEEITTSAAFQWFNNELLFDFISKRVNAATGHERPRIETIPGPFNAPTVYSGSFRYLGFTGLFLMALALCVVPSIYFKAMTPSSPFFLTGLAIMNAIFLFAVFDNTIRFTGFSFQLVYPILLSRALNRFGWVKRMFSFPY